MPVRKVKKALKAVIASDETVTSASGELNHRDWKVILRRFGESLIVVLGSAEVMAFISGIKVRPETYTGLMLAILFTVCQWCRYRKAAPPSQPPTPLPPQEQGLPDYSHRRHDLRISGDTDEFHFERQAQ